MASKLGKKAFIKELNQIGIITKLDDKGNPLEVTIGDDVIQVIGLTVKILGFLKSIWLIISSIFSKK